MIVANACASCTRLEREVAPTEDGRGICTSFPEGIPWKVWSGDHAHQVPLDDEAPYEADPDDPDGFASYVEVYESFSGEPPKGLDKD